MRTTQPSTLSLIAQPYPAPSFDPAHFARLAAVDRASFWYRGRYRLVHGAIRRFAPRAESVLDVGCGTGGLLEYLAVCEPRLELAGLDAFPEAVEAARARVPTANVSMGDLLTIGSVERADVVTALDVLEHVADHVVAIRRVADALRPGGLLLLLVPQHPSLWSAVDDIAQHERRYRRDELAQLVSAAGLQVQRASSFVMAPLPAAAVTRRLFARDPLAPLLPPPTVNAVLERILAFEVKLILRGIRLPLGLSSFVAATSARA